MYRAGVGEGGVHIYDTLCHLNCFMGLVERVRLITSRHQAYGLVIIYITAAAIAKPP